MRQLFQRVKALLPEKLRSRVSALETEELLLLAGAFAIVVSALAFLLIAGKVMAGDTQRADEAIIQWFRQPADPALPKGPPWLREALVDITALGSFAVILLLVLAISGFLWIHGRTRLIVLLLISTAGGMLMNSLTKQIFDRPRPSVVPHLREVFTPSFPSGHAAMSAIVYLTIGVLLFEVVKGARPRMYCLGVAMAAAGLVGFTRVYLGVHYPSDVLAGWATGIAWASGCWVAVQYAERRQRRTR